ncbi:hypothetical protein ACS15_5469 [Ralstonia insidiosa]|uniref:Uncharacterized protein n=1 Tax=Ralstonia insidiosa TaxID=190721 RepID=A0AAC9FT22_9RALS|nr:hypothetical protein ACS15_5469 [Ralstonia insidiosa]
MHANLLLFVRRDCRWQFSVFKSALAQHRRSPHAPCIASGRVSVRLIGKVRATKTKATLAKQRKTCRASDAGSGTRASKCVGV